MVIVEHNERFRLRGVISGIRFYRDHKTLAAANLDMAITKRNLKRR